MSIPDLAIGPVVAAVIAGTIAYISAVLTKESKTSEFRQAWIDSLRSEIADAISHAAAIAGAPDGGAQHDAWDDIKESYAGYRKSIALIKLRLNPAEASSKRIIEVLEEIETELAEITDEKKSELKPLLNLISQKLPEAAQPVLKAEWSRVKRGETIYVYSWRAFAGIALVGFTVALAVAMAPVQGNAANSLQGPKSPVACCVPRP